MAHGSVGTTTSLLNNIDHLASGSQAVNVTSRSRGNDHGYLGLAEGSIDAHTAAEGLGAVGAAVTPYTDLRSGHGALYATGDAGVSWEGGAYGTTVGAAVCGGPEDGVGIVCGLIGGFVGSGAAHAVYSALVTAFETWF